MKDQVRYELMFRITGFNWRGFDTYNEKDSPELKKYFNMLNKQKFNDGVKIIKIQTTREEVFI